MCAAPLNFHFEPFKLVAKKLEMKIFAQKICEKKYIFWDFHSYRFHRGEKFVQFRQFKVQIVHMTEKIHREKTERYEIITF